jgi:hypothetical protein
LKIEQLDVRLAAQTSATPPYEWFVAALSELEQAGASPKLAVGRE